MGMDLSGYESILHRLYFERSEVHSKTEHQVQRSHTPPAILCWASFTVNSDIRMRHLLQLMNNHRRNIITPRPQFTFRITLGVVHSMGLDRRMITHRYRIIQNRVDALKILYVWPLHPSLLQLLATTDVFTVSTVLLFPKCHIIVTIY